MTKTTTKPSEPEAVDAYLARLKHPMAAVAAEVRRIILAADRSVGEEIKWNAPAFFFTGPLEEFDPKLYRRHLVIFNFFKPDCLRLVFWEGAGADDGSGFLEGDYPDGRRLASLRDAKGVAAKRKKLQQIVKLQLARLKRPRKI